MSFSMQATKLRRSAWGELLQEAAQRGDAARPPHGAPTGRFSSSPRRGLQPEPVVVPGSEITVPTEDCAAGSVGDADYSPLVRVDGIVYDAPIVACSGRCDINFASGKRTTLSCMIR